MFGKGSRFCRPAVIALPLMLGVLASQGCESPPASSAVVFEGARLIVGDGSPPVENAALVVDGGRFVHIGPSGELDEWGGARRVDVTGTTVMPAIIDTHTHLNQEREALIEDLRTRARFGVSAAMSLGRDTRDLTIREEEISGAARFRSAGVGITSPEPGRSEIPHWVNTEDEARQAVRDEAARKVDVIKIWVDDRNGQYEKLSPELYGAIIDEAHQNGIRVTAHIFALEDTKGLLRAGIDAFAHGVRDTDVDEEIIELFKERSDVVLVPNLPNRGVETDLSWLSGTLPPDELEELQEGAVDDPDAQAAFAIQARNLARLSAEGVTIALGTDGNTPWAPHVEMEDMVAAGMTPAEVIVAATRNGADFLGLADTGTLEVDKRADFLVLEANPLDDITNSRKIVSVYLNGEEVVRPALGQ
ncbi:MAG: amidohydrolase family protein [Bryobacterales bacterium]|nr:amidohydrolase family protein [Bryobacterales bacterium]